MLMHSNGIIEDMRKHDKLTNNKEMMSWLDMNASILHTGLTKFAAHAPVFKHGLSGSRM